ncbi:Fructosamine kinase-domain-containing protein [Pestalotiopsis sp. NC0098]|nr:Fructosamine kinase-domain-containing protein [Pestalotiopsis sp. NC0098]
MAGEYLANQLNAEVHRGKVELDDNIIAQLPEGAVVKSSRGHGANNWNETARVDIEVDGKQKSYFLKRTTGEVGGPMLHGEFESMRLINTLVPSFSPKPLSWGRCANPNVHFLLFEFHELKKGLPDTDSMSQAVAQLHTRSIEHNPTGKWGFHMTTYNGPLAQDNTWTDTWEEHWIRAMRQLFAFERASRGPSAELDQLLPAYFDKVCPRLLRPLETGGRDIKPVLIHGDLWVGNMGTRVDTGDPFMFDAAAFWGHNEYELSYMRPMANQWGKKYIDSYHKIIPKSEPQEDWDARQALYATRVVVVDSALYKENESFRKILVHEIRKLVEQFPDGYTEEK